MEREEAEGPGKLQQLTKQYCSGQVEAVEARRRLAKVFYQVGLIGLRADPGHRVAWTFLDEATLAGAEISDAARVEICPVFWRVLGVRPTR